MTEYTIKVQHDEDEVRVVIQDLDPANFDEEKPAILSALKKAVALVDNNPDKWRFQ